MLEKISLFTSKKDFLYFLTSSFIIFFLSVSLEYYNYKELTKFDSALIDATVIKQYTKIKLKKNGKTKVYQVLKLKSDNGFTFYSTANEKLSNLSGKKVKLEIWAGKISFYEYMKTFFAFSKIIKVYKNQTLKNSLNSYISKEHKDKNVSAIYQALYCAKPLDTKLQTTFSYLGISHLIAISGFHLGVLSAILFFIIKFPYKFLQNKYFPYRSYKKDTFFMISVILLSYLLFLDSPPSLLRAFVMLIVGFILYDRGIKIISMQTLLLTVIIILALFPRLFFSIGFWLSVSGVFYIFLFLIHFKNLNKIFQFLLLPFWIYLMMLPYSLAIFGNFSVYHPLSIIWTSLFSVFYPFSIILHILGIGDILDFSLQYLLSINPNSIKVSLNFIYVGIEIILSIIAIYKKVFVWLLLFYNIIIFILLF
jgi:competence protein ComEC